MEREGLEVLEREELEMLEREEPKRLEKEGKAGRRRRREGPGGRG